jgi:hypothetical protein
MEIRHRLAATIAATARTFAATAGFVAATVPVASQPVSQMKVTWAEQATQEAFFSAGITG